MPLFLPNRPDMPVSMRWTPRSPRPQRPQLGERPMKKSFDYSSYSASGNQMKSLLATPATGNSPVFAHAPSGSYAGAAAGASDIDREWLNRVNPSSIGRTAGARPRHSREESQNVGGQAVLREQRQAPAQATHAIGRPLSHSAGRSRPGGHASLTAAFAQGVNDSEAYRRAPAGGRELLWGGAAAAPTIQGYRGLSRSRVVSADNPFAAQLGGI